MFIDRSAVLQHPVLRLVDALDRDCDDAADVSAWSLSDAELREALPDLTRVLSRVTELQSRLLAEADRRDLGDVEGHHDAAGWFANATRTTRPVAKGLVRLARALDSETHEPVREALGLGRVLPEQAQVIVEAVDALTGSAAGLVAGSAVGSSGTGVSAGLGSECGGCVVEPGLLRRAEEHLVALAEFHDAKTLRVLGRRILEVVDPDAADEHERRLLEAEERRAAAKASFSIRADGHGMMLGRFAIPELAGAMLKKHLDALAAPKHRASKSPGPDGDLAGTVTRPLRLGEAFCEYVTSRPVTPDGTPKAGGVPATVVVTMTHETLTGRLHQAGLLDTGERISASAARLLACQAGIIPAVLGTVSQPLDLGRRTRFHTEPQRVAIALRDQGCAEAHCDWPPGRCHIHHRVPWSRGGPTDTRTGLMLCPRHHTLAHDARYQMTDTLHGKVRFSRRT